LNDLLKQIHNDGVKSIAKAQLLREYNCRFYNPEFYSTHPQNSMWLAYEDNARPYNELLEDVLMLCLNTDVCKRLNMSFTDLMKLDLATYTLIKEKITADNKERLQQMQKAQDESDRRYNKLIGNNNESRR
jgi:hypothetical protein